MRIVFAALLLIAVGFGSASAQSDTAETEILATLDAQVAAWNAGDIPGYMEGFWNSEQTRYVSGATVVYGWRPTLERYQRNYDTAAKRGVLTYSNFDIRVLSPTDAFVFCLWRLTRSEDAGGDIGGAVTKLFRKTETGWKVVHNHVAGS